MTPQTSAYVDVNPIILTHQHKVILARRKRDLVEGGKWHLPGGRVLVDEDFKTALKRIAFGKTNLIIELYNTSLKESLVDIYDDPKRDPREHVIGLAFTCKILGGKTKPKQKVTEVKAFHRSELGKLEIAFDHQKMIKDAFINLQKERKL